MNEYTPTTEEARATYTWGKSPVFPGDSQKYSAEFDRWLARHDAEVEAELEARIEDRDYWYRIATEAKDQRDAALSTIAKVREAVSGHPECDRYEEGGVVICGWKSAYASVVRVLGSVPSTGEGNDGDD